MRFLFLDVPTPLDKKEISMPKKKTVLAFVLIVAMVFAIALTALADVMHKVYFSCCSGYTLQRHTLVNAVRDYCSVCGWVEGSVIV